MKTLTFLFLVLCSLAGYSQGGCSFDWGIRIVQAPTTNNSSDGILEANSAFNGNDISYSWYDSGNAKVSGGRTATGLRAGTYNCQVREVKQQDGQVCSYLQIVELKSILNGIEDTCDLSVEIEVDAHMMCSGSKRSTCTTGIISLMISGGEEPYNIDWVTPVGGFVVPSLGLDSFSVFTQGEYYAIVTDSKGCVDTTDVVIILINGIDDQQRQGMKFYPNPMTDKSIIEFEDPISFTFRLYNLQGQLVSQKEIHNSNTMEIHRGDLNQGIYIYNVILEDGSITNGRIVIE